MRLEIGRHRFVRRAAQRGQGCHLLRAILGKGQVQIGLIGRIASH